MLVPSTKRMVKSELLSLFYHIKWSEATIRSSEPFRSIKWVAKGQRFYQ